MPAIKQILEEASRQLIPLSSTPTLDAEVLLAHLLSVQRSYLYAHLDRILSPTEQSTFTDFIAKRAKGYPIPYLTGHCEFWSLDLTVTPDTLIPRPETELLVELILEHSNETPLWVADLGTGSGAIALALAHERPNWTLYATDLSQAALSVAKNNATRLGIHNIIFRHGKWCAALPQTLFDIIVSNPPYIADGDPHLEPSVLATEPALALISGESGLKDIAHIIHEAKTYLKPRGTLLLEHGFSQAELVQRKFLEAGYKDIVSKQDFSGLNRVTSGVFDIYF